MSQMGQTTPMQPRALKGRSNIYTVLMIIAAVALAVGVGVVVQRKSALFGDSVGLFQIENAR